MVAMSVTIGVQTPSTPGDAPLRHVYTASVSSLRVGTSAALSLLLPPPSLLDPAALGPQWASAPAGLTWLGGSTHPQSAL